MNCHSIITTRKLMSMLCGSVLLMGAAQSQTPNTVVAGPYGVPRLVRTEGDKWSVPVQVFSNAEEVVYVPDITTPGWAQWHEKDFKERNSYFTYVYTYLRKQRVTVQETFYVNTHTQHVVVMRFLRSPLTIDLHNTSPAIFQTVAHITKIVQDSIAGYHGPSLGDVVRSQKNLTLQNLSVMEANEQGSPRAYSTNKPRLISVPTTKYPQADWDAHVSGVVTVGMTVEPDGTVADIHIVKSVSPSLDTISLEAVKQARFEPARDDITGAPISAVATLDFIFAAH